MESVFEFILIIILEPILTVLVGAPAEHLGDVWHNPKLSKGRKALIFILLFSIMLMALTAIFGIVIGVAILISDKRKDDKDIGFALLMIGIVILVIYAVIIVIRLCVKKVRKKREREQAIKECPGIKALFTNVHVVVYRPPISVYHEHSYKLFGVNYGFLPDVTEADGKAQEVYILGVEEPVSEFDGVVIAVIHRLDDDRDKWVVAPPDCNITDEEILAKTAFQEKYFQIKIIRQ